MKPETEIRNALAGTKKRLETSTDNTVKLLTMQRIRDLEWVLDDKPPRKIPCKKVI